MSASRATPWPCTAKSMSLPLLYFLGRAEGNSPDERRGRTDTGLQVSIRCEAEKRVSHGEGLTRQPNERVAYWVLAVSHAGVTLRNCAATYVAVNSSAWGCSTSFTYSGTRRAQYLNRRLSRSGRQDYDVRNDQTLPDLRTATNQAQAYRYSEAC